jgi:hypothetical protein
MGRTRRRSDGVLRRWTLLKRIFRNEGFVVQLALVDLTLVSVHDLCVWVTATAK